MNKKEKRWMIAAASLILAGAVLFAGVMGFLKGDFMKLSIIKYETTQHTIEESFDHISIVTSAADITIEPSASDVAFIECYEQKKMNHLVSVQNGNLVIELKDDRAWYDYIDISFRTPKITLSIPQGDYGALTIKSNTGDIRLSKEFKFKDIDITESTGDIVCNASADNCIKIIGSTSDIIMGNITAESLDLSVSTGDISLSGVACKGDVALRLSTGSTTLVDLTCANLSTVGNTGDISLNKVNAQKKVTVQRTTGDVTFKGADASEIEVNTNTGDVKGSLLSDKIFIVETSTGQINVPESVRGGKCKIKTSTGDIKLNIQ